MTFSFFSCSNGTSGEEQKTADTTAAVTPAPAEEKPAFTPFKLDYIQHRVKNFNTWEAGYLAHDSIRKAYGLTPFLLGRDMKDSNLVYVIDKMDDLAKAQQFAALPDLQKVMMKAGVISKPAFSYAEVIRSDDSPVETNDRVGVAHHVKDFNVWLKAFDAEGSATRMANGLADRMIARSLIDSNMVYITFAVTDMAKAKARITSPELKKIMTDAGVDSPPTLRWYRLVK
jgi:hypothetical protein